MAFRPQEGRYKTWTSRNKKLPKTTGPAAPVPTANCPLSCRAYHPQAKGAPVAVPGLLQCTPRLETCVPHSCEGGECELGVFVLSVTEVQW